MTATHATGRTAITVRDVLDHQQLRTVFQPIVALDDRRVVAFEALTRGPAGSALERPDVLFSAARRSGDLVELDVACRTSALATAAAQGFRAPYHLFVNTEPDSIGELVPHTASRGVPVVLELTERALTRRPAHVLRVVAQARELGWAIALDDVGADPASLALLPLVAPDVIKLDLSLIQERPSRHAASVMNAITAEAERTGAVLLAEGIETEEHVLIARTFGATLGQGWLFGRPVELPVDLPALEGRALDIGAVRPADPGESPFEAGALRRTPRAGNKRLLVEVSKHLESKAADGGESALLLATFQHARHFTPATRDRYADLARRVSLVAAIGEDLPAFPLEGVRGAELAPGDPVLGEWDVVVLTPDFAATLVARDLGDDGPEMDRRFDFVLSHDRDLAIEVARGLLLRIAPEGVSGDVLDERAVARAVSQDLLHRALDASITGIAVADVLNSEQPLVWVNPAFSTLSGYRAEDVIGRNCRFLQGPGTDQDAVARLAAAIVAGEEVVETLLNYRLDGTPWWNELHLSPVRDDHGVQTHVIAVQHDVTRRVLAEERAAELASTDVLTGLMNRQALQDAAVDAVAAAREQERAVALLFLDLDGFKAVNDRFGHQAGDTVLRAAAQRLRGAVRSGDGLGRLGGDEFLVVLGGLPVPQARVLAGAAADRLTAALVEPFLVGSERVQLGVSIGVAVGWPATQPGGQDDEPLDVADLLRRADDAMFAAKRAGGGRWQV